MLDNSAVVILSSDDNREVTSNMKTLPKTGVDNNSSLYSVMVGLSGMLLMFTVIVNIKKEN